MSIPAAALIKVGLGLGVLGAGATGVYFLADRGPYFTNKYDNALLSFLDKGDEYDIVFDVKKGSNGSSDLADTDSVLSSDSNPTTVKVKVTTTAGTTTSTNFKKGNDSPTKAAELGDIAKLDNGTWTWSCEFTFSKATDATQSSIKDDYRQRIIHTGNKGLFGILKKNLNGYTNEEGKWTREEIKDVKRNFIKQCAKARWEEANKNTDASAGATAKDSPSASIGTFEFQNGTNGDSSKLVPKNSDKFEKWFLDVYRTKDYKS